MPTGTGEKKQTQQRCARRRSQSFYLLPRHSTSVFWFLVVSRQTCFETSRRAQVISSSAPAVRPRQPWPAHSQHSTYRAAGDAALASEAAAGHARSWTGQRQPPSTYFPAAHWALPPAARCPLPRPTPRPIPTHPPLCARSRQNGSEGSLCGAGLDGLAAAFGRLAHHAGRRQCPAKRGSLACAGFSLWPLTAAVAVHSCRGQPWHNCRSISPQSLCRQPLAARHS